MWLGTIAGCIGVVAGFAVGYLIGDYPGSFVGAVLGGALGLLVVLTLGKIHALDLAASYHRVTCPETDDDAFVRVDPKPMLTGKPPRVTDCSRWPAHRGCSRRCETRVDV